MTATSTHDFAPDTAPSTLALKEWGAVAHALMRGRQSILLRKGGIHERRFHVPAGATERDRAAEAFVLFPTVAHSHAERVRPGNDDLLALGQADVTDTALVVRCGVRLVDTVEAHRPERLSELGDLHIWTDASIQADRVAFRPKFPLHVLVVEPVVLPQPVEVARTDEMGGCRSWVDLPLAWDGREGTPVLDRSDLAATAERVRATVG